MTPPVLKVIENILQNVTRLRLLPILAVTLRQVSKTERPIERESVEAWFTASEGWGGGKLLWGMLHHSLHPLKERR